MPLTELRGLDERLVVDTSEARPVFLLAGSNGGYLRISEATRHFLQRVQQGTSFEELARSMRWQDGSPLSAEEVESKYRQLTDQIARFEEGGSEPKGAFWFRRRLVRGATIARLAALCSAALRPAVAVVLVAAIVAAVVAATRLVTPTAPKQFWLSYAVFLVSLLVHELGHASACVRFGGKPSDIGIVIYLLYPSFYSDVTVAWEFRRHQRVVVDLAGVYFQLIFGAGCVAVYAVTGWEPLEGALLFIMGSCLFSLNPILKFDGYWVVADALGVTNLGRQRMRLTRHLLALARGRAVRALPWTRFVSIALALYTVVALGFWVWFLWRLCPTIGHQIVRWGEFAAAFGRELIFAQSGLAWETTKNLLTSTFVLLFVVFMTGRLLAPAVRWVRLRLGTGRSPA